MVATDTMKNFMHSATLTSTAVTLEGWLFDIGRDFLGAYPHMERLTMIGRELQAGSVSSVIVDNEVGAQAAIEHLFSLGHRQVAFLRGPRHIADTAP